MIKFDSRTLFRYVFEFVTAGFIGWIYEVITVYILYSHFVNRGMLHLPIVPIYAVGGFLLLAMLGRVKNPIIIFIASAIITTFFELGASYLLEFIFHRWFWTYEGWWGSILDRSCVISSLIFGAFALIYFKILHPISAKISQKISKRPCMILSTAIIAVIAADLIISVTGLL